MSEWTCLLRKDVTTPAIQLETVYPNTLQETKQTNLLQIPQKTNNSKECAFSGLRDGT